MKISQSRNLAISLSFLLFSFSTIAQTAIQTSELKDGWTAQELAQPFNFDGSYTSDRKTGGSTSPIASGRIVLSGKTGSIKWFPMQRMNDRCIESEIPLDVTKTAANRITFIQKQSTNISFCKDITLTLKLIKADGKIGLGALSATDIRFFKE